MILYDHLQTKLVSFGMQTGQNGTDGEGAKMPSDGNNEEEEGDGEIIILCSIVVERVVPGG
ncbi:hypothetical protein DVH24_024784 [Malus domestica]|uniref:Uncharacterized protein n=1 Tax=Malus domestica TaxID=3750 RepID=A0A498JHQ7_MALDO|nr:hypothetical protein DVH24_024784 [Malus domestica]